MSVVVFTTSLNYRLPLSFSPLYVPMTGTGCLSHVLGRASYLCIPSLRSVSRLAQLTPFQKGYSPHFGGSALTMDEWLTELKALKWLLWSPFIPEPVCSDSPFYIVFTRISTYCSFMHGDCSALRATLRSLSGRGSSIVVVIAAPLAGSTSIGVWTIAAGGMFTAIRSPLLPPLESQISLCFCVWASVCLLLLSMDTARPFPRFSILPAWPSGRLHS